jgi:hypothetical protein
VVPAIFCASAVSLRILADSDMAFHASAADARSSFSARLALRAALASRA